MENPFERFRIPPSQDPKAITKAFQERMAEAKTEDEKSELRAAWKELTKHPERTAFLAALAYEPAPELMRPKRTLSDEPEAKILFPLEEMLTGKKTNTDLFRVTDHPDDPVFE